MKTVRKQCVAVFLSTRMRSQRLDVKLAGSFTDLHRWTSLLGGILLAFARFLKRMLLH